MAGAASPEEFEQAFLNFCALPSDFLPRKIRTDKLLNSLLAGKPVAPSIRQQPRQEEDPHAATIRRCKTLAAQGLLSKAARALNQAPVADLSDPAVEATIRAKHPKQKELIPPRPDLPPTPPPLRDEMAEALRKMANGTKSAVTAWTKELLRAAVAVEEAILDDLGVVFSILLDGKAPELTARIFNVSRLVALKKPNADLRPICVTELLAKLFGAVVLMKTPPALPTWQLGFATPSGCQKAILKIKNWAGRRQTILTIDIRNAFNELCRKAIFEAIQRRPGHELMLKWFFLSYSVPSDIFAPTLDSYVLLKSETGTRQGTTDGSYLFDIALCDAIEPHLNNVEKVAVADDVTLSASPSSLFKTLNAFVPALRKIGLEINPLKSELVCFHAISDADTQDFRSLGVKIVNPLKTVTRILGTPLSAEPSLNSTWVEERLAAQIPNELFSHPDMDPRLALTLLKSCHLPRAQYLAQTVPPDESLAGLNVFDTNVRNTVRRIFGDDVPANMIANSAGLGLKPLTVTAPLLYQRMLDDVSGATVHHEDPQALVDKAFPTGISPEQVAQSVSQKGHHANIWTAFSQTHFPPAKFIDAIRLRCGLPTSEATFCRCGMGIQKQISHPTSCKYNSSYTAVHRHNDMLGAAASTARTYGFTVTVEPHCYEQDFDARRPDILFSLGSKSLACDLTVVDPSCTAAVNSASVPGSTADQAAIKKIAKHSETVSALGHKFYPWAMETFGHVDQRVVTCLRALALELPQYMRKHFIIDTIRSLSTQLQIGNTLIMTHWKLNNRPL